MLRFIGLAVDDTCRELRLKNFQNVQWISQVEILDKFVGDLENKLSFPAGSDLNSPELGVLDGRQADVSVDVLFLDLL